ncbi:MAG: hypothetical protein U0Q16_29535 [Bryobacteraceae bacterium]
MRVIRRHAGAVAIALLTSLPATAGARHDFDRAVFFYSFHPDVPMSRFIAGEIGIPEPSHAYIYHFAAYRYFEGKPLTRAEQQRWLAVWKPRAEMNWFGGSDDRQQWLAQRARVKLPAAESKPQYRVRGDFVAEPACAQDAFDTAARTLAARISRFGADSAEVRFWTQGQDVVFAACAGKGYAGLDRAPAAMPVLIRADRDYQIAAALFYASRYDEAISAFRAIAKDPSSQWRVWAPYQVGRTMLARARAKQGDLRDAEKQFRAVVADPALRETHAAAERLLIRCVMITDRRAAMARLSERLLNGTWSESDLWMYLDGLEWLAGDPWRRPPKPTVPAGNRPPDALSQWILAFRYGVDASTAISTWKRTGSRAWLYAALWYSRESATPELLDAARQLPQPVMHYAASRVLLEKGQFDTARELADKAAAQLAMLPSAHNRALQLRAQLSATPEEFARLAARKVVVSSSEFDPAEWKSHDDRSYWERGADPSEIDKFAARRRALRVLPRFDDRAADIFNERIPLLILVRLAESGDLPPHIRQELAVVAWLRAVLLSRIEVARRAAPLVAKAIPAVAPAAQRYLAAPSGQNAALVLLELPGARPYVSRGYGRALPITECEELGRNWWFRLNEEQMHGIDMPYNRAGSMGRELPSSPLLPKRLPFLTDVEQREAAAESEALRSTKGGVQYVSEYTMDALRNNPSRADAPQLLRRLLDGARRGPWPVAPDDDDKYPALAEAWRLFSTRYRSSPSFRNFDPWELPYGVVQ